MVQMGGTANGKQKPRPAVHGLNVDRETRCAHYHSARDVVAIRMKCCDRYYACKDCHDALAGHTVQRWPRAEWDEPAVLCGACGRRCVSAIIWEARMPVPRARRRSIPAAARIIIFILKYSAYPSPAPGQPRRTLSHKGRGG
jgi:uncharacterized CHY-type Zn-finger protein